MLRGALGRGALGKLALVVGCGLIVLLMLPVLLLSDDEGMAGLLPGGGGALKAGGSVPEQYRQAITAAAGTCEHLTPSLLAAQLQAESDWQIDAVSPVGAVGMAQFMPGTWASYGQDGNGDGVRDIRDPYDAIASMAHYDCAVAKEVADVPGDPVELMLAAYNAGPEKVRRYGGVPPYRETRGYVARIKNLAADLAEPDAVAVPAGRGVAGIIAWARAQLGTSYHFGGDCTDARGPNLGRHCDCSSLMQLAYLRGAGLKLPRTTYEQINAGPRIPLAQIRPGDLIFPNAGHVGMYVGAVPGIGDHVVIHAPRTGDVVKQVPLDGYWSTGVVVRPGVLTAVGV